MQRTRAEEAYHLSSTASVVLAKKARVDDGGRDKAAADDCDLAAEGRGKRAAAKSAAGVCARMCVRACACACACAMWMRPYGCVLMHM